MIATLLAVGAFGLDRLVLTPLSESTQRLAEEHASLIEQFAQANRLIHKRRDAAARWRAMRDQGLEADPAITETRMLRSVRAWSREAGLNLESIQPERTRDEGELRQISFQATATGSMQAVTRFIYAIETAREPVRLKRVNISGNEKQEDLTLEFRISTLYRAGGSGAAEKQAGLYTQTEGDTDAEVAQR